ncbi:Metallo-dependent phosphatase-like protein, partial [Neohortaea acidophila]
AVKKRPLHGRFLHITDFHPDPFYKVYTSTSADAACHRGQGPAGIYGAESSDCDSPVALINHTMKWVGKEFKDQIDFVVWTGDSARHDNDEDIPRSEKQVVELNEFMVQKMYETFGKGDGDEDNGDPNSDYVVPIIPTLGNNDILPHNIFRQGPNKWTRNYARIWRSFIPEEQRHQFEQGGWFYVEVIRNQLAVFSLNTIYFFKSNAAVDGCALPSEPGYQHFEWLRIQLQFMRDRGMKAILIGHVPPAREDSKWSWDETCWQKYTLWLQQYRDVVVGGLYGHFNYDHFMLQDFEDLRKGTRKGKMPDYDKPKKLEADDVEAAVSSDYFTELRDRWSKLPDPPSSLDWPVGAKAADSESIWTKALDLVLNVFKGKKKKRERKEFFDEIGGEFAERFAAAFVSASVVPNLFPSFRIYEYNITGLDEKEGIAAVPSLWEEPTLESSEDDIGIDDEDEDEDEDETHFSDEDDVDIEKKKKKKKKKKSKKHKFAIPDAPSDTSSPGPAYSPQPFSWTRYTQYLANLTHINNDFAGNSIPDSDEKEGAELNTTKWNKGKHSGKKPPSKGHKPDPKTFKFQVHYDTKDDEVYHLQDLTMPRLVDLATRVGNYVPEDEILDDLKGGKKKKKKKERKKKEEQREINEAWWTFIRRAFVETMGRDELRDEF